MRVINIETKFSVFDNLSELPIEIQKLFEHAKQVRENSYSPYSNFSVGAAVLLTNDEIVSGSNQENASFPAGLCAERTALFYSSSKFPNVPIKSLAIVAGSKTKKTSRAIPPCGSCRQVIAEYEVKQKAPIEIYFKGEEGEIYKSDSLANLLPLIFDGSEL